MKSFFGTLKTELVHYGEHPDRDAARRDLFAYVEGYYNRQRRHSAIGYSVVSVTAWASADDEDGLTHAIEAFRKAMLAKDKTQFNALCADELTYGHSSGKVENKAEFILGAISPKWHWNTLEFVRVTTKASGDFEIARSVLSGVYEIADGTSIPISDGVLMVWRKQGSDEADCASGIQNLSSLSQTARELVINLKQGAGPSVPQPFFLDEVIE